MEGDMGVEGGIGRWEFGIGGVEVEVVVGNGVEGRGMIWVVWIFVRFVQVKVGDLRH